MKCPENIKLASYVDGILSNNEKENMEKHLVECSVCLDNVILYHKINKEEALETVPEVPDSLLQRAKGLISKENAGASLFDIVLKFAQDTIEIITNPSNLGISHMAAPVPVRGEESALSTKSITLHKTLDNISVEVEITKTCDEKVNIRTLIIDTESGKKVEGLRVNLFNPDREMASSISKEGEASFKNIIFGKYIIKINKQGKEVGQISLNIKE